MKIRDIIAKHRANVTMNAAAADERLEQLKKSMKAQNEADLDQLKNHMEKQTEKLLAPWEALLK